MEPREVLDLDEIDLSDLAFWERPIEEREGAFRTLRRTDPRRWFAEPTSGILGPGRGYYALVRYDDVVEVSRHPERFCSSRGGTNIVDLPPTFLEFFGSMINMDDPRHARLRRIVSPQFTPRRLAELRAGVESAATEILDEVIEAGECDFVTDIAARLPLRVIVDLMGIPRSEERFIFDQTNLILGFTDEEYVPGQDPVQVMAAPLVGAQRLFDLVQALGEERLRDPKDDLTTALVTATVDGERLSPQELGAFFVLLVVAGNETTRNAIAHGLVALTEHPDQRARWWADFEALAPTAVEEIVRWATPVIHFRRTVTRDGVRLGDLELAEGDKVVMWYASANRDEDVFDDPYRFDVGRQPNDHVGFGGPGPHFCLGAHLARREITVMFRELARRIPDIEAVGEPQRLRSNFINGIKHLPARWTPRRRQAA
ncbi:MAG: cytochrome P450 [Acidimicrobiia bacterium]